MNKSMLAGIGIGVAAALGVAAVAGLNVLDRGPQYAQVVSSTPIKESVKTPRQECRNVTVTTVVRYRMKTALPVRYSARLPAGYWSPVWRRPWPQRCHRRGALGGGYAGNQIQGSMQEGDTYTTTQQRCKTVYDKSDKMLGYDVTYKIGGQQGKIRMEHDPGTQIPLDSNGQLILNNKA
nr:17 kDa surface antigen [Raoultella sp. NCTC 9187]